MEDPAYRAEYEALQDGGDETIRLRDLRRLDVRPGDVLVYRHGSPIPGDQMERAKAQLRRLIPDERVKIMVIDDRADITVIRPAP